MCTKGRSGSNCCMFTDNDVIYGITAPDYYRNVGADDDVDYDENGFDDFDNVDDDYKL